MKNLKLKTNFLKANEATKGFTLIELLVVIAIIGLLSSIVLASLGAARNKAADAAIQADLVGVRSSAELYYADNGESYGTYVDAFTQTEADCPLVSGSGSIFYNPSIMTALQHAINQNGGTVGRCGSNAVSWAAMVQLKTQADSDLEYFCVDSTGTAKISSLPFGQSIGRLIEGTSSLNSNFYCEPTYFVN